LQWFYACIGLPFSGITASNPISPLKFDAIWYHLPANKMFAGFFNFI